MARTKYPNSGVTTIQIGTKTAIVDKYNSDSILG